ncbi:MAG: hypothetical protein WBG71_08040, partial [Leeuwenhoekiella sp.]
ILITDLKGNFINGYEMIKNKLVLQYVKTSGRASAYLKNSDSEECLGCPFQECIYCTIDEVIVIGSPDRQNTYIALNNLFDHLESDSDCEELDGCIEEDWDFGGGGSSAPPATKPCPEGYSKNDLDQCILDETPCAGLDNLASQDSISGSIGKLISDLRNKTSATNKEHATGINRNCNYGECYFYFDDKGFGSGSLTSSPVIIGKRNVGSIHTHPLGTYNMFSWKDVRLLRDAYREVAPDFRAYVFVMMLSHDGSIYSLRVNDFAALDAKVKLDWKIANILYPADPIGYIDQMFQNMFSSSNGDLEKAFLSAFEDAFGNQGISVVKATDNTLNDWAQVTLDPKTGEVNEKPCN